MFKESERNVGSFVYLSRYLDGKEKQLALSHETDTDTIDRSTIRLAFHPNIEFPGFRRSNQFVAIRTEFWIEFTLNNLFLEQSVTVLRRRTVLLFTQ